MAAVGDPLCVAEQISACPSCALRVKGCREPAAYLRRAQQPCDGDGAPARACGLCLGLVERPGELLEVLAGKLSEGGFDDKRCELSISLPVLCVFRQELLLCYLESVGGMGDYLDLKDLIHMLASNHLSKLGWTLEACPADSSGDSVRVVVRCEYGGPANSDLDCLRGGGDRPKKKRRAAAPKATVESNATTTITDAMVAQALGGRDAAGCLAVVGGSSLTEHLGRVDGRGAVHLQIGRESLYIRGRYQKLSRTVPQSAWFIDGERKGTSSVEELITIPIAKLFGATDCKFHAEGREDIDVRMLGAGRTFAVEVQNARRASPTMQESTEAVNIAAGGDIVVSRLARCPASAMAALQRDAEKHRKTYVCVCWSQRPLAREDVERLNAKGPFEVEQKTPVRVLHRRGPAVRPKTVFWLDAVLLNAHYLKLRLSTEAGMYIKEFVHSDLGRTRPSLRSLLGGHVEILQLDVEGLEDDGLGSDGAPAGDDAAAAR